MKLVLRQGNCIEVLKTLKEESIESVLCDPPYGLEFMGDDWKDTSSVKRAVRGTLTNMVTPTGKPKFRLKAPAFDLSFSSQKKMGKWHQEWLSETYRVLQKGGTIKAFSATRTFHRFIAAMEQSGFSDITVETWQYLNGFPKSYCISHYIEKPYGVESADLWRGWRTTLKPSYEPIIIGHKRKS